MNNRGHGAQRRPGRLRRSTPVWAALLALTTAGCDQFLSVENPNNIAQADLERAEAANAAVNGAYGTVTRGIFAMWGPYSTATDEVVWIGSRDAWQQLDFGFVNDPYNEFTDAAFQYMAQGRWMADEAIQLLEGFEARGEAFNRIDLARAYLYGAIAYTTIADQFDRFVISNRMEAGPPIAPDQMDQFYQTALNYLDKGMAIAQARSNAPLQLTMTAMRARVEYSLALWQKLNPQGSAPANPLINDAEANAAARQVLAMLPEPDWRFLLEADNGSVASPGEVALPYNINRRRELQFGTDYVILDPKDPIKILGIALEDPITGEADPVIERRVAEFRAAEIFSPYTVVSAREMHLILAEAALAQGDLAGFRTQINQVRALDNLPEFTGQIAPLEMLKHARRVNLFLQTRRLADHYRFAEPAELWREASPAIRTPGTFFPITIIECRSNPNLGVAGCGG